jgi:hypothetical protein
MVLSEPAGQAPDGVLVCLDGAVGVAIGAQRPRHGEHGEVRMTYAKCYRHMERYASTARAHDRGIRAAQQVRELSGVGDRLVPVAVVWTPFSAALNMENAAQRRASSDMYPDIDRAEVDRREPGPLPTTMLESAFGVLVAAASTQVDMVDDDTRNSGP